MYGIAALSHLLPCNPSLQFSASSLAGAEEPVQDPKEQFNETGVPIEPFNLDKEREEGVFDAGGGYVPSNFPQVKDAWLESIDGKSLHASQ